MSCLLEKGNLAVEVLPEAGFSLISFKYKGRELLDRWDIAAFTGSEADIKFVSENVTDTFRKGFGPSIGPWFGGKEEGSKAWNHGVCRFADWSKSVKSDRDSVTGRLKGDEVKLLGMTLDEICGFHLDVEIAYVLTTDSLEYSVLNRSEGKKGTFGIHWYFKSPAGTKVIHKTDMQKLPEFDKTKFGVEKDVVVGDPGLALGQRFDNLDLGPDARKTRLTYPDGLNIDFRHSDSFKFTMLFSAKQFVCVEPISGPAWQVGTFDKGVIGIKPA